jgi:hypothetical protein
MQQLQRQVQSPSARRAANLKAFLLRLSTEARLRQEMRRDPEAVLRRSGLSAADRQLVCSGDSERIRTALGADRAAIIVVVLYA